MKNMSLYYFLTLKKQREFFLANPIVGKKKIIQSKITFLDFKFEYNKKDITNLGVSEQRGTHSSRKKGLGGTAIPEKTEQQPSMSPNPNKLRFSRWSSGSYSEWRSCYDDLGVFY